MEYQTEVDCPVLIQGLRLTALLFPGREVLCYVRGARLKVSKGKNVFTSHNKVDNGDKNPLKFTMRMPSFFCLLTSVLVVI